MSESDKRDGRNELLCCPPRGIACQAGHNRVNGHTGRLLGGISIAYPQPTLNIIGLQLKGCKPIISYRKELKNGSKPLRLNL